MYNLYTGSNPNNITNNYFNVYNNSPFRLLTKEELSFLLSNLNFKISMRESLNLDDKNTFGTEIEFQSNKNINEIYCELYDLFTDMNRWKLLKETSANFEFELISPVLKDNETDWNCLKEACTIIKQINGFASECTGSHIHIGSQIMKDDLKSISNLLKVWAIYEHIIYRFAYGENSNYRSHMPIYASSIADKILKCKNKIDKVKSNSQLLVLAKIDKKKSFGLDFSKTDGTDYKENNTIEIRCPNGTLESPIWQNNINFFVKLLSYINSDKFDENYINNKYEKLKLIDFNFYHSLDIKLAIELCDMIFDNNLDKLYFLRQYYKNGNESGSFEERVVLV